MGDFSWLYATRTTKQANINPNKKIKLLIPKEYIDTYGAPVLTGVLDSYGRFATKVKGKECELDLYGVLAFMNKHMCEYCGESIESKWKHDENPMGLTDTHENRNGIGFGCYAFEIICSDFPLKLVPYTYNGTYEECNGVSFTDPYQGCGKINWDTKRDEDHWVNISFDGQGLSPITFTRLSYDYDAYFDRNGNESEWFKSVIEEHKNDAQLKNYYLERAQKMREDSKVYFDGLKALEKYKTIGDLAEFYWDMRNNIEKYPKFKERYIKFWKCQPNPAKQSLI